MQPTTVPFAILRAAYQHALDTETDNLASDQAAFWVAITTETTDPLPPIYRARDYWPECVRLAVEEHHLDQTAHDSIHVKSTTGRPAISVKVATKDKQP